MLPENTKPGSEVRPLTLRVTAEFAQRPIMLHELLHAYHSTKMARGFKNAGILMQYNRAKDQKLYSVDGYLMTNHLEFFAVTASVFLYGKDGPVSRSIIKERQPDYYKYLVSLFGFDPDPSQTNSPLAFAQ
jgi:Mlc titration factor MtfA (ptsG expression regulator)